MSYSAVHIRTIINRLMECEQSKAALKVWAVLQFHAAPGHGVVFTRGELAEMSGVTVGTVSRVLPELEAAGVLERVRASNPRGGVGPISVRMKRFW